MKLRGTLVHTTSTVHNVGSLRTHLGELRDAGVGYRRVAEVAGVAPVTVWRILHGRTQRVLPGTLDRLMAVTPSALAPGVRIPPGPALALVEILVGSGLPEEDLWPLVTGVGAAAVFRGDATVVTRALEDALAVRLIELEAPHMERRVLERELRSIGVAIRQGPVHDALGRVYQRASARSIHPPRSR